MFLGLLLPPVADKFFSGATLHCKSYSKTLALSLLTMLSHPTVKESVVKDIPRGGDMEKTSTIHEPRVSSRA